MKKVFFSYVLAGVSVLSLAAESPLMPGLARVRNRVDTALNSRQGDARSFKELLAQNGCLSSDGKVLNCTLTATDAKPAENITASSIEQQMNQLYWSNQVEFIEKFCQVTTLAPEHALAMLNSKLQERYKTSKAPLIAMAQELGAEENVIEDLFLELLKLSEQKQTLAPEQRNVFIDKIKQLYERRDQQKYLYQKFVQTLNTLLLAK